MGDLFSITVTRYCLAKILNKKEKLIKYIGFDILGIVIAYFITLLPTIIVLLYSFFSKSNMTPLINAGFIGNIIIPFILYIFAMKMPFPFIVFVAISILSITIPTLTYLFMILFFYMIYRVSIFFNNVPKRMLTEEILKKIKNILIFIITVLATVATIFGIMAFIGMIH